MSGHIDLRGCVVFIVCQCTKCILLEYAASKHNSTTISSETSSHHHHRRCYHYCCAITTTTYQTTTLHYDGHSHCHSLSSSYSYATTIQFHSLKDAFVRNELVSIQQLASARGASQFVRHTRVPCARRGACYRDSLISCE